MNSFFKSIFAVCVLAALAYTLFFVDKSAIRTRINDLIEFIHAQGALGIVTLIFVHSLSIAFCFPATIMFEWASGYIFGWQGVLIVLLSKTIGGVIGFTLGKTLLRDWAEAAVQHSARMRHVFQQIGQDGLKFAFLLRLSPAPSWVCNYGLALSPLTYRDFAIATMIGSLPFIVNNVYMGSLGKSLTDLGTASAGDGEPNYVKMALIAMGGVSMMFLTKKIVSMLQLPDNATTQQTQKKKAKKQQ